MTVITSSALRTARTSDQLFSAHSVADIGVPLLDSLSESMCGTAQPKAAPPGVWAGNRNDCAALRLKAPDMMPDDDQRNSRICEPPLSNSNSRRPADRKSVVSGTRVSVRVDLGGCRIILNTTSANNKTS